MKGFPTLGDMRKEVPAGGLLNPSLRKGFGSKTTKIAKRGSKSVLGTVRSRSAKVQSNIRKRGRKARKGAQDFSNVGW